MFKILVPLHLCTHIIQHIGIGLTSPMPIFVFIHKTATQYRIKNLYNLDIFFVKVDRLST